MKWNDKAPNESTILIGDDDSMFDYADVSAHRMNFSLITRQLDNMNRYLGSRKYSVGGHSCICAWAYLRTLDDLGIEPDPDIVVELIQHDFSEAFLCDIPPQAKRLLPGYVELQGAIEEEIRVQLGLDFKGNDRPVVKMVDFVVYCAERVVLFGWPAELFKSKNAFPRMVFEHAVGLLEEDLWCAGDGDLANYYEGSLLHLFELWMDKLRSIHQKSELTDTNP